MHAANKVRESGYTDFDIYTPYPIHGLDKAMGVKGQSYLISHLLEQCLD